MARGGEGLMGLFDRNDIVTGRMTNQERFAEILKRGGGVIAFEVVEEISADWKGTSSDRNVGVSVGMDFRESFGKIAGDVFWVEGRVDGDDGAAALDLRRGANDSGAAEGMADEERGGAVFVFEKVSGSDDVGDI